MAQALSAGRLAEQNARLKARLEKLQRLIEVASEADSSGTGVSARSRSLPFCHPPGGLADHVFARVPQISEDKRLNEKYVGTIDGRRRLLPFPGYANASGAEFAEECIGLNLLGAEEAAWQSVLRDLQAKISKRAKYTYVCVTSSLDFSYFVQRGVTFEYISYLDRLTDPNWRTYFLANMELIKRKYGLKEFITIGDPKYAA